MIGLFKRKRHYQVVQLFKIVDSEYDDVINAKVCALRISEFFLQYFGRYPDHYTIDYSNKLWKTKKGFDKVLKTKNDEDLMWVWQSISTKEKTDNHVVFTNPHKNFYSRPKKYKIALEIVVARENFNQKKINLFLKELYAVLPFDYGFARELDDTYDFTSGNKRSISGKKNILHDIFYVWHNRIVAVQYGFLIDVFKINYLNASHLARPQIENLKDKGVGAFEPLNEHITIWKLSSEEQEQVRKELECTEILMAVDPAKNKFLRTDDAKKFKEWMDFG